MSAVNIEPIMYAGNMTPQIGSNLWARERIVLHYKFREKNDSPEGKKYCTQFGSTSSQIFDDFASTFYHGPSRKTLCVTRLA